MIPGIARTVVTRPGLADSGSHEETDPVIDLVRMADAFLLALEGGLRAVLPQAPDHRGAVLD